MELERSRATVHCSHSRARGRSWKDQEGVRVPESPGGRSLVVRSHRSQDSRHRRVGEGPHRDKVRSRCDGGPCDPRRNARTVYKHKGISANSLPRALPPREPAALHTV